MSQCHDPCTMYQFFLFREHIHNWNRLIEWLVVQVGAEGDYEMRHHISQDGIHQET